MINERKVKLLVRGKEPINGFYKRENLTVLVRLRSRLRIREYFVLAWTRLPVLAKDPDKTSGRK